MDDPTVTTTNPAPSVDAPAAQPPTAYAQESTAPLALLERIEALERQCSSWSKLDANAVFALSQQLIRDRCARWHETYNAYLPIAHELAKLTEDKVPRLMARAHEYALLFANRTHGEEYGR